MSAKQHVVRLTPEQRGELKALLRRNATTALEQRRARILLQTDDGRPGPKQTDAAVAAAVGVDRRTVARVRAVFATAGFAVALHGQRRLQQTPPKLDSSQEARLVALACMDAPGGHAHWTLRLLAGRAVELAIVDQLSHETVRKTLKKKAQAVARGTLGNSAGAECRLRGGDGRRLGRLRPPRRSAAAAGLLR